MEQSSGASAPGGNASQGVAAETSLRGWFYVIGFLGLAIALASIADMFSTRPYDGIVPAPYSRKGIDVRATTPGGPAAQAGIPAGDCVLGIGRHNVNSISDATNVPAVDIRHKVDKITDRGDVLRLVMASR